MRIFIFKFSLVCLFMITPYSAKAIWGNYGLKLLNEWQYDEAENLKNKSLGLEIAEVDRYFLGNLAFISGDYLKSLEYLSKVESPGAKNLENLVRSTQKVVQDFETIKTPYFFIRHPGGKQKILIPLLLETLSQTIDVLAVPWGVKPK